ncbi:hypothetical protein D3C85_1437810 [compost metagenome]
MAAAKVALAMPSLPAPPNEDRLSSTTATKRGASAARFVVGPSSSKRKVPLTPRSTLPLALSPSASVTVCTRVSTPLFRVRLTLSSGLLVLPCQTLSSRARVTAPLVGLMVRVK